jgi:hypothetical protein
LIRREDGRSKIRLGEAEEDIYTTAKLVHDRMLRTGPTHLFRADIAELVVAHLGDPPDHIVIESWHTGRGVERHERR